MKSSELVTEIKNVFVKIEYPGDDGIVLNVDTYQESYDMWFAFKGHWRNVSSKVVESYRISFGRFTPEGFCFYLPAIMIAALDPIPYEVDEYLVQNLSPPSEAKARKTFDQMVNILSTNQKRVVEIFIRHFVEENPLFADEFSNTLEYWSKTHKSE